MVLKKHAFSHNFLSHPFLAHMSVVRCILQSQKAYGTDIFLEDFELCIY